MVLLSASKADCDTPPEEADDVLPPPELLPELPVAEPPDELLPEPEDCEESVVDAV